MSGNDKTPAVKRPAHPDLATRGAVGPCLVVSGDLLGGPLVSCFWPTERGVHAAPK